MRSYPSPWFAFWATVIAACVIGSATVCGVWLTVRVNRRNSEADRTNALLRHEQTLKAADERASATDNVERLRRFEDKLIDAWVEVDSELPNVLYDLDRMAEGNIQGDPPIAVRVKLIRDALQRIGLLAQSSHLRSQAIGFSDTLVLLVTAVAQYRLAEQQKLPINHQALKFGRNQLFTLIRIELGLTTDQVADPPGAPSL